MQTGIIAEGHYRRKEKALLQGGAKTPIRVKPEFKAASVGKPKNMDMHPDVAVGRTAKSSAQCAIATSNDIAHPGSLDICATTSPTPVVDAF